MMIGLPSIIAQSVYLVIISLLVPASLRRARWVLRSPRVAMVTDSMFLTPTSMTARKFAI